MWYKIDTNCCSFLYDFNSSVLVQCPKNIEEIIPVFSIFFYILFRITEKNLENLISDHNILSKIISNS
jgi:hypothetical protein